MKNQNGFTLLEILVVLTIMGFLIAMVAPRLAGISGDAVDTVCDSNQNRMVTYMSSYFEKTNRFPNNLTNIVEQVGAEYQIPSISDQNPDNGPETLAAEFNDRNHFMIHYLNDAEAAELKAMGIVTLINLNSYTDHDVDYDGDGTPDYTVVADADVEASLNPVPVESGVGVAMVGMGDANTAGDGTGWAVHTAHERGWGEPGWFGRMVFGMGPECSLVTSGVVSNAAHCPGGIQNTDNCTYNDYNLVLPRLASTVNKIDPAAAPFDAIADADATAAGLQLLAVSYDDDAPTTDYDVDANDDNFRTREFTITEAEETWQFATQCPEGHMYPEDDGEFWGIPGLGGDALLAAD
jgi:prepilin-type N-terminal cleavage/methylation domain-containing protein